MKHNYLSLYMAVQTSEAWEYRYMSGNNSTDPRLFIYFYNSSAKKEI